MLKILHVEDSPFFAAHVAKLLAQSAPLCGRELTVANAQTIAETEDRTQETWDILLLDLTLPDSTPEQTLEWLAANAATLPPVIVVTGTMNDAHRRESFMAGAKGFIHRDELTQYPCSIIRRIEEIVWIADAERERLTTARKAGWRIAAAISAMLCMGCAQAPQNRAARAAYALLPNTVSMGVFIPPSNARYETALVSISGTWQLKPFWPPVKP